MLVVDKTFPEYLGRERERECVCVCVCVCSRAEEGVPFNSGSICSHLQRRPRDIHRHTNVLNFTL